MNREQKAEFVEDLRGRLQASPFLILASYKGSTVAEMDALRRACEPGGVSFQVVKNTLARRAVDGTDLAPLAEHFSGPIGVVISGEDPATAAKAFNEQAKKNKFLEIQAGYFEGDLLDATAAAAIADMPSKEELHVLVLQTLLAAPRQVLGMLQAAPRDLLYLLRNYEKKLEDQG